MGEDVTLRDVYDLVGESRRETNVALEKVNGDITELKVDVGKLGTRMDGQDVRISANTSGLETLRDKVSTQRLRAAQLGGVTGGAVVGALKILEWILAQLPG